MTFLGIASFLGIIVFIAFLTRAFIKRDQKKIPLIGLLACLILFGVAVSHQPTKNNLTTSAPTPSVTPIVTPSTSAQPISGTLTVNYLNVGQGDSEFIELPNGQTMLIDSGNPGDGTQISKYIKDKGYTQIDYLIATHPHADHIGGMAEVLNSINVASIYMPKAADTTETYKELLNTIQEKGLTVNTAKAGVSLVDANGLKVYMIAPNSDTYDDLNNYSAVIKIEYKKNSFLFMGDAQTQSEGEILSKSNINLKSDVLKVGHHGSDTSSSEAFLKAVAPKYAVISVGADNDYGHPKQTTLDKLSTVGAAIYRTDKDGTIIMTSDGTTITVTKSTFQAIAESGDSKTPITPSPSSAVDASAPPSSAGTADNSSDDQNVTVYITKSGTKYHRADCRTIKGKGTPISLAKAKAEGYTPCKVCNPPD